MHKKSRQYLLSLARHTLEHFFDSQKILQLSSGDLPDTELAEKRGTFVTLTKNGQLRGCIGHLEPVQEIYQDVIDNALSAAFEDPRFEPLRPDELKNIEIEISILTEPQELVYNNTDDLLNKLSPLQDGVIIKKGNHSATYLPQVWEELSDKEDFLSSLCQKAGLEAGEWRKGELRVWVYQTETFSE